MDLEREEHHVHPLNRLRPTEIQDGHAECDQPVSIAEKVTVSVLYL